MRVLTIVLFGFAIAGCVEESPPRRDASQPKRENVAEDAAFPENGDELTEKEVAVCAAAIRYAIYEYPGGGDGIIFLAIGEKDAPPELLGHVFLPASRAHSAERDDPMDFHPKERIRDKITGEPGTIITVTIMEWIGDDRAKVKCESYTDPLWAGGCDIFLQLKEGDWLFDGDDPDSHWAS